MADSASIEFDTREVEKMTTELLRKVQHPQKLLRLLERVVNAVTKKMFRGRRPDNAVVRGVKWQKLKTSTIKSKRARKKSGKTIAIRPMVDSGELRDSLKILSHGKTGFIYGTRKKSKRGFDYPAHQAKRFPWLFLTKKDFLQFERATIDFLNDSLKNYKTYVTG
jgi:phage gpG-like protein